jgi:hypothetical protein
MSQGLEVGALVSKSAKRLCQKLKGKHSDGSIGQQHHLLSRNLIVQHKAIQGCLAGRLIPVLLKSSPTQAS